MHYAIYYNIINMWKKKLVNRLRSTLKNCIIFYYFFFFRRLINCKFIRNVMLHGWYNGDNGTIYIFHLFIHLFIYLYFAFCKI